MKLTTNEIGYIAGLYDNKTDISLFSNIKSKPEGTEEKTLREKGVYAGGSLSESAKEMLDIIAYAKKCSRIVLQDNFCIVEKYTYMIDDKIVLVENAGGELLFSFPQSLSDTVSELSEFTGMSRIKNSNVEVRLSSVEIIVLLSVIDIYRKNAMLAYIGNADMFKGVPFSEIKKQLEEPAPNSLVKMLIKNYNFVVPQAEGIKAALDKLGEKNCVLFDDGYKLSDEYALFSNSFLIPETLVMLECINLSANNEIINAGALCLCAGIKDIASFIFSNNETEFSSISGMQLLQMTENFLKCPDLN